MPLLYFFSAPHASGSVLMPRDYFPFGEELVERNPSSTRLEFTGHDRDDDGSELSGGDLDYMHARYYSPALGRFLSRDAQSSSARGDETWNRIGYTAGDPVQKVDPDGLATTVYYNEGTTASPVLFRNA